MVFSRRLAFLWLLQALVPLPQVVLGSGSCGSPDDACPASQPAFGAPEDEVSLMQTRSLAAQRVAQSSSGAAASAGQSAAAAAKGGSLMGLTYETVHQTGEEGKLVLAGQKTSQLQQNILSETREELGPAEIARLRAEHALAKLSADIYHSADMSRWRLQRKEELETATRRLQQLGQLNNAKLDEVHQSGERAKAIAELEKQLHLTQEALSKERQLHVDASKNYQVEIDKTKVAQATEEKLRQKALENLNVDRRELIRDEQPRLANITFGLEQIGVLGADRGLTHESTEKDRQDLDKAYSELLSSFSSRPQGGAQQPTLPDLAALQVRAVEQPAEATGGAGFEFSDSDPAIRSEVAEKVPEEKVSEENVAEGNAAKEEVSLTGVDPFPAPTSQASLSDMERKAAAFAPKLDPGRWEMQNRYDKFPPDMDKDRIKNSLYYGPPEYAPLKGLGQPPVEAMHYLPLHNDCTPQCTWKCDTPMCDEECAPVCQPPRCQTRCAGIDTTGCKMECEKPHCAVTCPKRACPKLGCASCSTTCTEAMCKLQCPLPQPCRNVCEEPSCEWKCKAPNTRCPQPQCNMVCEAPKLCMGSTYRQLPGLEPGEMAVESFLAPADVNPDLNHSTYYYTHSDPYALLQQEDGSDKSTVPKEGQRNIRVPVTFRTPAGHEGQRDVELPVMDSFAR